MYLIGIADLQKEKILKFLMMSACKIMPAWYRETIDSMMQLTNGSRVSKSSILFVLRLRSVRLRHFLMHRVLLIVCYHSDQAASTTQNSVKRSEAGRYYYLLGRVQVV